ncbi:MAG: LysM peptidoglycan-binding domain-containing protein [Candidatus Promineifilaceae bacterium]|nr:LysM peptidoglycan-binding domain-containing protein [Candidatus Promineifilaceae bacterium]
MKARAFIILFLCALLILPAQSAGAQEGESDPPPQPTETGPAVHVIQPGETLLGIAEQYGTTVETLQLLNDIQDPATIYAGQALVLPGGEGARATLVHLVQVGESLNGLAVQYDSDVATIAAANRLIHPERLVVGEPLRVVGQPPPGAEAAADTSATTITGRVHVVEPGDTLLAVAAAYGVSPAAVRAANNLSWTDPLLLGQRLRLPGEQPFQFLPAPWKRISTFPTPAVQGQTLAIYVEGTDPGLPSGLFGDRALRFAPHGDGYVALLGLDAFLEPGRYTLQLDNGGARPWPPFSQALTVISGGYLTQTITVPANLTPLLDPAVRAAEDAELATYYAAFSPSAQWSGPFQQPITNTVVTARYGDARSYNGGPIEIFHTGVDYAGPVGTPIYAPAPGTAVFSDTMPLHGGTLLIDHGLGVVSGYYHLSEIRVTPGEAVGAGQLVGLGGSTGLSTGPHLHWDLRILGVPVNGLQWIEVDLLREVAPEPP